MFPLGNILSSSLLNVYLAGFIQSIFAWDILLVSLFSFMSLDSFLSFFRMEHIS